MGLFILNLVTAPGHWWFYWPLIFWGIGLSSHALSVFGFNKLLGKEWEEKKIEEYMQKYEDKNKE